MAKKKQEDPPKGSPAWMATFSDLMNLLLCFFVLLFSMSTVDAQKFQEVVASLQSAMSILPAGGASIGDGQLISAGVRQLEFLDSYYNQMANSAAKEDSTDNDSGESSVQEQYEKQGMEESEKMAESVENQLKAYGIQDMVEVEFNAQFVQLSLSGAVLFESAQAELVEDAYPIVDKICLILANYNKNIIEVEGHADNVPLVNSKYEDNDVLSMYRALNVANYIRSKTSKSIDPAHIKSSGRGSYVPIADNATAEGRARNRRVEIKIYNSYNSDVGE